ncbi:hypothetical protein AGRA3207_002044 [Actinomadura graeca]|uniref:ATP-binding protein n=1 Tax=Actinomadura graeca TaxID=2750812 RepID=A0ABX8QR59_9ACTN|nr:hypothetical protein [Actinomadura graeca]QXJ21212.1 hypothetical protein AGRA3207_002044 [Actinomadura graeca]
MKTGSVNGLPRPQTKMAKIGLWGASGSGKTSYLAALYVAVTQNGKWNIGGVDQESVDFLTEKTDTLTQQRRFPDKTEGIQNLSWNVMGETEEVVGGRFRRRVETVPLYFQLDMLDAAGQLFKGTTEEDATDGDILDFNDAGSGSGSGPEELIDQLASCDGIVYLFDPVRENKEGDEFRHVQWALQNIVHRASNEGRLIGRHLPHFLAVCITKLDDPKVFHTAYKRGYLTADPDDPHLFPRVREDKAEDLFRELGNLSPTRSALMVHNAINAAFLPDRVCYFATSSVGFYLARTSSRFRAANFQNVVPHPTQEREYTIRGDIHPINVLEPLLWLGEKTRQR